MNNIEIVYSKRKTICLQVKQDGKVRVLAPVGTSFDNIKNFVSKHRKWLDKTLQRVAERAEKYDLEKSEIEKLRFIAKQYIPERVQYYSNVMNLYPTNIKITSAKTRFGSCNSKNTVCFSLFLMKYPKDAIDYVVVHELAHIKEKNHSARFYSIIESVMPDYKQRIKLLK